MNTILAVVIMTVMAVIGFFIGITVDVPMECAILFALVSGIGCIIQAINKKPTDTEKE